MPKVKFVQVAIADGQILAISDNGEIWHRDRIGYGAKWSKIKSPDE